MFIKLTFFVLTIICLLSGSSELTVKSPAFANTHYIPFKYTCDGTNISPELLIENSPKNTKSLALIVADTTSPNGEFVHWVMWNIPLHGKIKENEAPGVQGRNTAAQNKYYGPCPPNGIHDYHFRAYALDIQLNIPDTSGKYGLLKAMEGHILASGELMGRYKRQ